MRIERLIGALDNSLIRNILSIINWARLILRGGIPCNYFIYLAPLRHLLSLYTVQDLEHEIDCIHRDQSGMGSFKLPVPDGNVSIMMEELLRLLPTLVSKYIDTE